MEAILIVPIILSFFATLVSIPIWIKRAKEAGLVGKDIHKADRCEIAEGGGISVLLGFVLGVLSYIALKTFFLKTNTTTVEIFALLTTVLITGMIGFADNILVWKKGLDARIRIILVIFAAIPLIVINAGESIIMGIQIGIIYPLVFIPLGIVATTTTFNMIAGYNGLETSQGIIILSSLAIVTFITKNSWLTIILLSMIASLLAFYIFNKNPAKVFPGDVLTYSVGAMIGISAILGNIEKIAIFFFIPYVLEVGLKLRGGLKKQSFGKLEENGDLDVPYEKFYGIEHIAIYLLKRWKMKSSEKNVVYLINLFQILIILLGFVLFGGQLVL